jgi:hypothetical protein
MVVPVLVALGRGMPFSERKVFLCSVMEEYIHDYENGGYLAVFEKSKPGFEYTEVIVAGGNSSYA